MKLYVLSEDYSGHGLFWAQHGISFLVEFRGKRFLFDTGSNYAPIEHNLSLMGLELKPLDFVVISHSHYDHTGGLPGVLKKIGKVPVYAHPDVLKESYSGERYIGPPEELRRVDVDWILSRETVEIIPDVFTTGEIPFEEREYFERRYTGVTKIVNGRRVRDYLEDEIGLLLRGERNVMLVGCSHPGIVSMVKRGAKILGEEVHVVIGGFHLIGAGEDRIRRTAKELRSLGVEEIYTGHCTGLRAECELREEFGEGFHKLHAGMEIELSER